MKSISFLIFPIIALVGCFDLFTPTKKIPGPYYLSKSETGSYWTLYYDLGGAGHGRIDTVNKIGWTDKYIFAEKNGCYYFLDKTKDKGPLNANEIVVGPLWHDQFMNIIDSLKIKSFAFELYLDN
jgi:hypothetical protein